MVDLQIRHQYLNREHGDVKLFIFPTSKAQAKLYKIVLDTKEADVAVLFRLISNSAMADMSNLIRLFYERAIQPAIREEYALYAHDEHKIWMYLEVVLHQMNNARSRLLAAQLMTIRVDKDMFPYLLVIARFAPSIFSTYGLSNKFFDMLTAAYEALKKEQL